ncbi:MAG: hypothetical protein GY861_20750 [bacterium]|nr:hypothetical protein [bacterium]
MDFLAQNDQAYVLTPGQIDRAIVAKNIAEVILAVGDKAIAESLFYFSGNDSKGGSKPANSRNRRTQKETTPSAGAGTVATSPRKKAVRALNGKKMTLEFVKNDGEGQSHVVCVVKLPTKHDYLVYPDNRYNVEMAEPGTYTGWVENTQNKKIGWFHLKEETLAKPRKAESKADQNRQRQDRKRESATSAVLTRNVAKKLGGTGTRSQKPVRGVVKPITKAPAKKLSEKDMSFLLEVTGKISETEIYENKLVEEITQNGSDSLYDELATEILDMRTVLLGENRFRSVLKGCVEYSTNLVERIRRADYSGNAGKLFEKSVALHAQLRENLKSVRDANGLKKATLLQELGNCDKEVKKDEIRQRLGMPSLTRSVGGRSIVGAENYRTALEEALEALPNNVEDSLRKLSLKAIEAIGKIELQATRFQEEGEKLERELVAYKRVFSVVYPHLETTDELVAPLSALI